MELSQYKTLLRELVRRRQDRYHPCGARLTACVSRQIPMPTWHAPKPTYPSYQVAPLPLEEVSVPETPFYVSQI